MIGKSYFLSYLLVFRLLEGKPTVFLTSDNSLHVFCDEYMHYEVVNPESLDLRNVWASYPDADWWVLVDYPALPRTLKKQIDARKWTFVHAASPGSLDKAKKWSKCCPSPVFYMDVWSEQEMYFVG